MLHTCIFQTECLSSLVGPTVFSTTSLENYGIQNLFVRPLTAVFLVGGLGVECPPLIPSLTVCDSLLWSWAREEFYL